MDANRPDVASADRCRIHHAQQLVREGDVRLQHPFDFDVVQWLMGPPERLSASATRTTQGGPGEISALQPFGYLKLVSAAIVGWLVFAEWPDIWTWIGAAVIIASALALSQI